ncbi:MAG: 30S ribosomal protein S1 [Halobacteriovoraceae bacterium]|nr:30S ribosomal protein S1 [Halobacteriovoraceae bacterium]MCB9095473.1 30S ribosomal protein S1 [Halobacteriovoraceae bacterium]
MTQKNNLPNWVNQFELLVSTDEDETKNEEMEALLKDNMQRADFTEGEVFKGTIVGVNDDFVTVDIGYKQEGLVFAKEFRNYDGSMKVALGDEVDVYIEKLESSLGNLVLSKDKAEIIQAWDRISDACEKGSPVQGTVMAKVKGGLSVDIGVKAFLPGSQVDLRAIKNLDKYIGKTMEFKVIKFNKKRGNIVLSRRAILSEERNKLRDETLGQIQEGMIVKGIVKNITDYGAFIDLGGVDGLLHITDMSWGRVKHPSNIVSVGDEIDVKVLKYDQSKERVSLGLKQVQPNPWESAESRYEIGAKVSGEIVSIKDYGIFLELDDGIEGLIHVSEMSWTQKPKVPAKDYNVGDKVEAVVLEVDIENKRISLGLKQLQPNPWDKLVTNYSAGKVVEGTVKSVVDFGAFVDIGENIDALIHVSDISWTKKNVQPNEYFKEGEKVKAVVLLVDPENQKFCLGIKQLEEDPWKRIEERMPVGSMVEGEVVRVTEFGAFVELETGIEGLIHISELSEERVEKATDVINKGDKVKSIVISIDKEAKKIALSIKALDSENLGSYKQEKVEAATLAEKFKDLNIQTTNDSSGE